MAHTGHPARKDLYQAVTDKILADLARGFRPWHRPWHGSGQPGLPLRANGQPYQGINVVLLWLEAGIKGYLSPVWMTFRQAHALGAHVRRGETGSLVVYANTITRTEADEATGTASERRIPFLKAYTVFNLAQIEGLPEGYAPPAPRRLDEAERVAAAEAFFAATGAELRHGGSRAFYSPAQDFIGLPPFAAFESAESYYATLAHEAVHWSGHPARLARSFARFGDTAYAREELLAEMGAAFLCADLGLAATPRVDHASYLASWLEVLRADKRAIVAAAAGAQRAVSFLHEAAGRRAAPEDTAA